MRTGGHEGLVRRGHSAVILFVMVALSFLIVACGSESSPEPTEAVAPTDEATMPLPVSTPQQDVTLGPIVFATGLDAVSGSPVNQVVEFPSTTASIYAFSEASALPAATVLRVDWTIDGTPISGISQTVQLAEPNPSGWIEFHLDWTAPGSWPRGMLGATISVDDNPLVSGTVQIVSP